jgi:hypothetical protein
MTMSTLTPFANESDVLAIGNLTIENRIDRVSWGDVDITRDKKGLSLAKELQSLIDRVVKALEAEALPATLPEPEVTTVKNPF